MPDIRHQLQIGAAPAAIFPLFATAHGFAKWWAADARDIADPAQAVELGFFNRQTIYRLRPQTFISPTNATWRCETGREWAQTALSFALSNQGATTLLRFRHAGWTQDNDYFVSCNTVWGELLFRLKATAEGHSVGPLFLADAMAY
jgi:uncharacterized protein YndB with AHSA1/START domain